MKIFSILLTSLALSLFSTSKMAAQQEPAEQQIPQQPQTPEVDSATKEAYRNCQPQVQEVLEKGHQQMAEASREEAQAISEQVNKDALRVIDEECEMSPEEYNQAAMAVQGR